MFDISAWFDDCWNDFVNIIDNIIDKIDREYRRNRIDHEKMVKVMAWPEKLEFRSKEIALNGSWDDMEETYEYPSPLETNLDSDNVGFELSELAGYYQERGYRARVFDARYNVPELEITWD